MERECEGSFDVGDPVDALLLAGSDYPVAYRPGARVALQIDDKTGEVLVTRGGGALKVAYLADPRATAIASSLRLGFRYVGEIEDVRPGPAGKMLRLRLGRPVR